MNPFEQRGLIAGLLLSIMGATAVHGQVTTLLPAGSEWKYLDGGQTPASADWKSPGFDDSAWPSGAGPLGYNDPGITTTLSFGESSGAKAPSYFFRGTFDMPAGPRPAYVMLRLRADDGAIVHINGAEVFRTNMSTLAQAPTDWASVTVAGEDEGVHFEFPVAATLFQPGRNTIAAQVHQRDADSSDVAFDLEILGVPRLGDLKPTTFPKGWYAHERSAFGAAYLRGLPVVKYVYSPKDKNSMRMEQETFDFNSVRQLLDTRFVCLAINADTADAATLAALDVQSLPTIIVSDWQGRELTGANGFIDYQLLERRLRTALGE
ncbi:MAG: hypothetical protein SF028_12890 [Candidatus Sumerlaeia bacterium]|nr:hypothetical protein [Candidatus Sumerlaeia bacterium]